MIYSQNAAKHDLEISGPGKDFVSVKAIHTLENPNYIFVDLEIAEGSEETSFQIELVGESSTKAYTYQLREREVGSAERKGFGPQDVMYLITPDRFANGDPSNDVVEGMREGYNRSEGFGRHGGDIEGIRSHLDYIKKMGFTAIWLNPILENDQDKWSYHGYSTTDYYKVDPRYGSNEDYAALSREAADMGIKMIMDIIVNHCGSFHWWMNDPPSSDWIHYYAQDFVNTNHRKTTLLDPYVAPSDREKMVKGWFVESMPDLNQKNPFMSTYLIQNSIWWIEYAHLAGIRQDTYSYPYRDFMTDWTCAIMTEYPNFNIVGEEWVTDPAMISYWQRGKVNQDGYSSCLPSLMDFPMTTALHAALNEDDKEWGKGLIKLYEMLGSDYHYADASELVIFTDNHDMSRIYTQVDEDYDLFRMAIAYILTMRGTPQIYYGTEILMSHPGNDSHGAIRSDLPGGWDGDEIDAFTGNGLTSQQLAAQEYVKKLLLWRQGQPVVHDGDLTHYAPEDGVYVYFRQSEDAVVMVVINKNDEPKTLDLSRFSYNIGDHSAGTEVTNGQTYRLDNSFSAPGRDVLVLELD